ncbi:NirD/YgiW/YdeI family stress tolerance protein [Duganella sp. sic0402]|uniref:YgiW/YdeI family stress tolerance OB fold protein n=1 Tax=Duganella sp. sic0402 TaxID=2854786 RepID=UPI001C4745CE|nr:NirD/YgiW/YdeI family stress tolerance protein [Duganella sp. sic0402]MBV7536807.1 NirD/YgiW/YdeI family stress tolerance protein [Duganella sp. sic0402]
MKRLTQLGCLATLLAGSTFAIAQTGYTGPSTPTPAAAYAGPSSVPVMSAKDLLAKGKDDQYVTLKGKITSHKGGEDYEFTDQSGKITVEISSKRFPAGQSIDHNTLVELTGEFDKEMFGVSTLDVKQIKVVAK